MIIDFCILLMTLLEGDMWNAAMIAVVWIQFNLLYIKQESISQKACENWKVENVPSKRLMGLERYRWV